MDSNEAPAKGITDSFDRYLGLDAGDSFLGIGIEPTRAG
jgi:hypothetical protein